MKDSKDKNLTILIPSKGRPNELSALLGYFEAQEIKSKIIILESGNLYRNFLNKFSRLEIELHEFDSETSLKHKLLAGAHLVRTPLVCLCPDDDLVLKEGIEKCAEFLIENPEYSACQGYHAIFENKDSDFYFLRFLWFTPSLDSNDPLQRLQQLICRYHPVCWAVFRSDVLLKMDATFPDTKSPLFFELYWSASAALAGKVKRLPILYCLKPNDELIPMGHPLFLFAESPELFYREYLLYRSSLEKVLVDHTSARRILDLIHACLFHSAATQQTLQYLAQKALENPELSILNSEVYSTIKFPLACFEKKGSLVIRQKGRKYHFADTFLHPEPAEEIKLPANFHVPLLADLETFRCPGV